MKFDTIQSGVRVRMTQVPPDESLANRSVEKSAGMPGNGSPKPDGSSVQAVYCAPKYVEWWSEGASCEAGESRRRAVVRKATVLDAQRHVSRTPPGSKTRAWRHGGTLETWESQESPCGESGVGGPPVGERLPAWRGRSRLSHDPVRCTGTQSKRREARSRVWRGSTARTRDGLLAVFADHRTADGRRDARGRAGGEPLSPGPTAGKERPDLPLSGGTSGRDAGLTHRIHATPEDGGTGTTLAGHGVRTTCCPSLTVTVCGKPRVSTPAGTVRQGGPRSRRNKPPQTWTTPAGTCTSGVAPSGMSRRRSNGYGARRQGGSSGQEGSPAV